MLPTGVHLLLLCYIVLNGHIFVYGLMPKATERAPLPNNFLYLCLYNICICTVKTICKSLVIIGTADSLLAFPFCNVKHMFHYDAKLYIDIVLLFWIHKSIQISIFSFSDWCQFCEMALHGCQRISSTVYVRAESYVEWWRFSNICFHNCVPFLSSFCFLLFYYLLLDKYWPATGARSTRRHGTIRTVWVDSLLGFNRFVF